MQATVLKVGDKPRALCVGHSDIFYDRMYDAMASADHFLDMSSLDVPNGRFAAAFRTAFTYLDSKKKTIYIRMLAGLPIGAGAVWNRDEDHPKILAAKNPTRRRG